MLNAPTDFQKSKSFGFKYSSNMNNGMLTLTTDFIFGKTIGRDPKSDNVKKALFS